jgi:hypothetical protein
MDCTWNSTGGIYVPYERQTEDPCQASGETLDLLGMMQRSLETVESAQLVHLLCDARFDWLGGHDASVRLEVCAARVFVEVVFQDLEHCLLGEIELIWDPLQFLGRF